MSTCLRRSIGAVIIKDGVEVSSGYVGSSRGSEHCTERGTCLREKLGIPSGQRYELCRSVHAEQNAIINAARTGVSVVGGEMYIYSVRHATGTTYDKPCMMCVKMIINAGLKAVHMQEEGIGTKTFQDYDLKRMLRHDEEALQNEVR
jgi:dCMP deaminase